MSKVKVWLSETDRANKSIKKVENSIKIFLVMNTSEKKETTKWSYFP